MYSAGYHSITNIDYSSVCIKTMSARYNHCPGMTWHQMDIRQLSFPDASFDVILEKATLDAIMVDEKTPWEVSPQSACFIHQALTEVFFFYYKSSPKGFIFCNLRFSYLGLIKFYVSGTIFVKVYGCLPTENSLPLSTALSFGLIVSKY